MDKLTATDLKKFYGAREIFHDVNFSVNRSEKVGLVGANGTGKTTLFKILLGFEEFDELKDSFAKFHHDSEEIQDFEIRKISYGLGFTAEDLERSAV